MAKASAGQRINLLLDPRVALEAIILNRLERLPVSRRSEWLRGLLVQGFRDECRTLREASNETAHHPDGMGTKAITGAMKKSFHPAASSPTAQSSSLAMGDTAGKPFASLGKVIGQSS